MAAKLICMSLLPADGADVASREEPPGTGSGKLEVSRRSYIYESEDIQLEPGLVLRTKHEIELRERSGPSTVSLQ